MSTQSTRRTATQVAAEIEGWLATHKGARPLPAQIARDTKMSASTVHRYLKKRLSSKPGMEVELRAPGTAARQRGRPKLPTGAAEHLIRTWLDDHDGEELPVAGLPARIARDTGLAPSTVRLVLPRVLGTPVREVSREPEPVNGVALPPGIGRQFTVCGLDRHDEPLIRDEQTGRVHRLGDRV